MLNYFYNIKNNNIIYTVDMLRLSAHLDNEEVEDIFLYLNMQKSINYYYSESNKIGTYRHNYMFNGYWVGLGCVTSEAITYKQLVTIEFNPNKIDFKSDFFIYEFINRFYDRIFIKRFDLAVDIPENIMNLNFENLNKKSQTIYYQYNDNKTIYFGKGNGHTKIYNKTIESNLDYNLTRYEITKELDKFQLKDIKLIGVINFNFLKPFIYPYNEHTDNLTYNAISYALNRGYNFKDLTRDMRNNIQANCIYNIELSNEIGTKCLIDTINMLTNRAAGSTELSDDFATF